MFKKPFLNNQIRAKEVRLIDETGKQIGVVGLQDALQMARERNLDLIQVTEKVDPPVCRIEDYGKYLYREEKKSKAAKKPQGGEMKSIRLTFNISQHDLETRAHQAEKFLSKGDLVKIDLVMRGREKTHQDFAREKMGKFLEILKTIIPVKTVKEIRKEARGISMMVSKQ